MIGWTRLSSFDKGFLFGAKADMEELSAVGEQVFDAECILNKRLRKVRDGDHGHVSLRVFLRVVAHKSAASLGFFLSGKVGVSREVEGMVIQVSTSGAAQPETMKTTTTCRLLLLVKI